MMAVILFSLLALLVPQAIARKYDHTYFSYNAGRRRNKIDMVLYVILRIVMSIAFN